MSEPVLEALGRVADALRTGRSLRQALEVASAPPSPLEVLRAPLEAGIALPRALRSEATRAAVPELRLALLVLSVQAEAGGDPLPALRALEARLRRRVQAAAESRALTAQARMSARTMLFITPGFLALLFALDPSGTWASLRTPVPRLCVAAGLVLQGLGGWWIARIVGSPTRPPRRPSRLSAVPVVRVLARLSGAAGGGAASVEAEVADAADLAALLLEAGASPYRALERTAALATGPFGGALQAALHRARAGTPTARSLQEEAAVLGVEAQRFADAFAAAADLGVPLAERLRALADAIRERGAARVREEIGRASVRVLVPLALLVLPSFVLACLVPLLLGGLAGIVR